MYQPLLWAHHIDTKDFELHLCIDHVGHRLLKCEWTSLIKVSLLPGPWLIGWRNYKENKPECISQIQTSVSKSVPSGYGIYCQIGSKLPSSMLWKDRISLFLHWDFFPQTTEVVLFGKFLSVLGKWVGFQVFCPFIPSQVLSWCTKIKKNMQVEMKKLMEKNVCVFTCKMFFKSAMDKVIFLPFRLTGSFSLSLNGTHFGEWQTIPSWWKTCWFCSAICWCFNAYFKAKPENLTNKLEVRLQKWVLFSPNSSVLLCAVLWQRGKELLAKMKTAKSRK